MRRLASSAVAASLVALAPSARAVEREHHLGIEAGGSVLVIGDKSTADVGAGLGAHWTYGLSDEFNLVVDGSWSLVAVGEKPLDAKTPATRPASVASVDAGIAYVFDVLRWVPWASLELGGYALDGGTISGVKLLPGAALALGLDYRLTRSWAVGAFVRQHAFPFEMSTYPSFTQTFARFEYTWGW